MIIINTKRSFDIIPFRDNKFWVISKGRAYILNENNVIVFVSPLLTNMWGLYSDIKNGPVLYFNADGKENHFK